MEDRHLHLLITEDIYRIHEKQRDVVESTPNLPNIPFVVLTNPFSDIQKALLKKILASVQVDIEDVRILYSVDDIDFHFDRMLVFGSGLSKSMDVSGIFTPVTHPKGEVLVSKSLTELEASKDDKMKLWVALKAWFNI